MSYSLFRESRVKKGKTMDKYEFNIKVEQIKKMVSKEDYETAMKIADTIDWKRVRNASLLSMISQVYTKNGEYGEAGEILLLAYERAPVGKRYLYKLTELALMEGNLQDAEAYYREFCESSPEDSRQHVLRYMILKAKGAPEEQLIHTLERYNSIELDEKWMYELAELYQHTGMQEQCVDMCDKIMLMFGIGNYVERAMELKLKFAPLSNYQMDLVENRDKYEAKLRAVEEQYGAAVKPDDEYYNMPVGQIQMPAEEDTEEEFGISSISIDEANSQMEIDPELVAELQEAKEEERLAAEMSKISVSEVEAEPSEPTKIIQTIKNMTLNIKPSVVIVPEAEDEASNAEYSIAGPDTGIDIEAAKAETAISIEPDNELGETNELEETQETDYEVETAEDDAEDITEIQEQESFFEEEDEPANNFMIEYESPEEGFALAVQALKKIHSEKGISRAAAKITGEKLNKKGVAASADKLKDKDLIVERAGDLTPEMLDELVYMMDDAEQNTIVVLMDTQERIEELHRQNPEFAARFECIGNLAYKDTIISERVEIKEPEVSKAANENPKPTKQSKPAKHTEPEADTYDSFPAEQEEIADGIPEDSIDEAKRHSEMDADEFAEYACKYAREIDCNISGKSMLAMYEKIEIMEEDSIALSIENAELMIEKAADKAEKPSFIKLIKGIFSPKYDPDGLLILKEEHFRD